MTLTFGKYKNKSIEEVYSTDKSYILWLSENAYHDALKETVKKFLESKNVEDKLIKKNGTYVINFGKFYGKSLMVAYKDKPRYMNWMLRTFEDDELVQTVVNEFLDHMKVVNKRVKAISKVREDRIIKEKFDAANKLAADINNLNKDNFYIVSKIFKINSVKVCDRTARVTANVTEYSYSAMDNDFTVGSITNIVVTTVPVEFIPSEYEVVLLNSYKVYNVDGNLLETERKVRQNVRIMSDVYDDIVEYWYKGVNTFSSCSMGSNVNNHISLVGKVITIKVNNVDQAVRKYKISNLIRKIS